MTPEAELHYTRGRLHLRRGESLLPYAQAAKEMQTALENFDRAKLLEPTNPEIHYWMAHTLRHLEQPDQALSAARFALQKNPRNEDYARLVRMLEGADTSVAPPRSAPPLRSNGAAAPEPPKPALTWDDIVLPAKTKRELRQMQLLLENPAQARRLGVDPPTGLLLYGPPGTGKTTIARILAAQAKSKFFATSPAEVNSMWVGEGEKAVAKLFNEARQSAPAIIFLDEVDALIPSRVGGMHMPSDKVVNQFLHEMDGLTPNQGLFVVGATNRPDMLDPALVRGGRLSRQIEIPLPDEDARRQILGVCVKRAIIGDDVNLDRLAAGAEEFSGADLRALVNEAGMQALIRLADEGGIEAVTMADFEIALENMDKTED
ncbi:AAA family ATPase [Armatimonas sp.]|uniref:ATP-binding protein n=1 Tax=Armatimonas sp. TaxID=1872638 RepID=UPI0037530DBF